jgi:hypothetical protein
LTVLQDDGAIYTSIDEDVFSITDWFIYSIIILF